MIFAEWPNSFGFNGLELHISHAAFFVTNVFCSSVRPYSFNGIGVEVGDEVGMEFVVELSEFVLPDTDVQPYIHVKRDRMIRNAESFFIGAPPRS